ncbi:MAG: Crp/Fnr family transcriptional regulator [Oscillatoriales cyanobacterium SM2_2_1]|nr:Crp/Fnr family transcriptional regulator [Oscillatoriales cyanobacterium SM2_2_1]
MDIASFRTQFPLFDAASPETLTMLLEGVSEREFPAGRAVLMEESWGNAVFFTLSGWLKVRSLHNQDTTTLAVLGKGDFFGEMAILDESPRSTDVVAYDTVQLLSISAQRFVQALKQDSLLSYRLLQLMVKRLKKTNQRSQLRFQAPAMRVVTVLLGLGQSYGAEVDGGIQIYHLPVKDLGDLAEVSPNDTQKILDKLLEKNWLAADPQRHRLTLVDLKQLQQLSTPR